MPKEVKDEVRLIVSLIVKLGFEIEVLEQLEKRASTPQGQRAS